MNASIGWRLETPEKAVETFWVPPGALGDRRVRRSNCVTQLPIVGVQPGGPSNVPAAPDSPEPQGGICLAYS